MLFNNQHPPLEISPTDQRVWKEHPITRAFVFSFRPIQNQTWIQRQTAGWGRSNSACLSSALAKSSWSSSLRRGGLITRLIQHHTFFFSVSDTCLSTELPNVSPRQTEQNAVPSDHTSEQDSVQLTFVYNRELWLWKIHARDTRRLTDRFSISSPRDFVFWFFFLAVWQSQITDPETDMKLKKKSSKWNRSCQGNFAKPAAVREVMQHSSSERVLQNSSSLKCKKKKEGLWKRPHQILVLEKNSWIIEIWLVFCLFTKT